MSDLSRLLDDLYAMPGTEDAGTDTAIDTAPPRAPEWSSEEALDEAFASWVPGPGDDAPAMERSMVAGAADEAVFVPHPAADTWLQETEPIVPELVPAGRARWSPSDDDILPARRGRRRR